MTIRTRLRPAGWAETAWAATLLTIGALTLASAWDGWPARAMLVGAAVVPALLVRLAARRVSAAFAVLFTLIVLVGVVVLLGREARADGESALATLLNAVPSMLTGPVPAPSRPELLAPGVLLAGIVGALVGVRLGRPRRRRFSPVCGSLVLYAAGLALTGAAADAWGGFAAALVVVAAVGWATLGRALRARSSRVGVAIALVCVPLVVAAALPSRDGALDLRDHVDPPVTLVTVTNPLPQLAAWAKDPEGELFAVSGDAYPLHLAVLTDYDGASWSAPSAFRPLDVTAPRTLPAGGRQAVVRAKVRLIDVPAPWVPAPGEPDTIDLDGALVDPDTGSTIAPGARSGTTYEVAGRVDAPTAADVEAATLPAATLVAPYLAVPRLSPTLRSYAESAVRTASTPLQRALAIEAAVRGSRTASPTAPAGSSYRRIEQFLFGAAGTAGAQNGTSEQFATSFAVLARAVGLPTRVVVGFEPGDPAPATTTGERIVRGKHATAWPEVYFTGRGWVPFSPTPDAADLGPDLNDDAPISPPAPTAVPPAPNAPPVQPDTGLPGPTEPAPRGWLWVGLAAVAVALAPLALLRLARARRRRRQRRAGAVGAWAAALDAARLAGEPAPDAAEPRELAHRLDVRASSAVRPTAARLVVRVAEQAAFGPPQWQPAARAEASSAAYGPEEVWGHLRHLERALRRQSTLGRRLLWGVNPAPLRGVRDTKRNIPTQTRWTPAPPLDHDGDRRWAPREAEPARVSAGVGSTGQGKD